MDIDERLELERELERERPARAAYLEDLDDRELMNAAIDEALFFSDEALARADEALALVERRAREEVIRRRQREYQLAKWSCARSTRVESDARVRSRVRVARPRERRAVHGRSRRTSTTRDDGPAEPAGPSRGSR